MGFLNIIRRMALREKLPLREISRRTGLSRNTIKKYLNAGTVEPKFATPQRASKLDPFAEKLGAWLKTEAGGLCVGLLPESDWREANQFVTLPIATGIGKARNVLIAQSSAALVAVGGQYGTLSEIAFGLHFDKPVFGLGDVPDLADIRKAETVDEVCRGLAAYLLRLPDLS